jgi:hypothetical protein
MLQHIAANTGVFPNVMMLDAGYWWEDNTNCSSGLGIDAFIATGRLPHNQSPQPRRDPMPR